MAGIGAEDGGHTAGHGFHGDQIGAAFAAIGKQRGIGFAQDRRHQGIRHDTEIKELFRLDAIRRHPGRAIQRAIGAQGQRRGAA